MVIISSAFFRERWHIIVAFTLIFIGSISALIVYDRYTSTENDFTEDFEYYFNFNEPKKTIYYIGIEDTDYPPLLMHRGDVLTGLDIDIISWIAEERNIDIAFILIPWEHIFDALRNGEIDMIMTGASITPERLEVFLFSDPYLTSDQVIVISLDKSLSIQDFYEGRGRIGVEAGTTSEDLVFDTLVKPSIADPSFVHTFTGIKIAADAIVNDEIDYLVTDFLVAVSLKKEYSLKMIGSISTGEAYGIVFRKDDIWLRQAMNIGLKRLFKSSDWDAVLHKWYKIYSHLSKRN